MSTITQVHAREIIDSRGNPTVEADVILASGTLGRAAVPSGASTGTREAVELRDGDSARFLGRGVTRAVENVNTLLREALIGKEAIDQAAIAAVLPARAATPGLVRRQRSLGFPLRLKERSYRDRQPKQGH